MTSILSAVSGQFGKSLVMGTLLPVTVFVLLVLIFVLPILPSDESFLEPLESLGTAWKVVVVSLMIFVLTGMLYGLNTPIIRFYEGYPWKDSWIGQRRTKHYVAQYTAAKARWQGMNTLLVALDGDPRYQGNYKKILREWHRTGQAVKNVFPRDDVFVLPTQLGNVIRSFEHYPYLQYGMSSITLWPRLVAKIDKDYAALTDDAKASFDFMLNSSFLAAVLALTILLAGLLFPVPLASLNWLLLWLLEVIVFLVLAYWFYLLSIDRAGAWGDMVKGVFDLYRWDLLKQLGHQRVPTTVKEERELWYDISLQMIYGDAPTGPRKDYVAPDAPAHVTSARGKPESVELDTTRQAGPPDANRAVEIDIRVKNVDAQKRTATDIVVTDFLPDDLDYQRGSAHVDGRGVRVLGTNPFLFHITGDLTSCAEFHLIYGAIPRKSIEAMLRQGLKRFTRFVT